MRDVERAQLLYSSEQAERSHKVMDKEVISSPRSNNIVTAAYL